MRMWMLPVQMMCGRHRSGEHNEIHKHLPALYRGVKIEGRICPVVQVQVNALQVRHDELAETLRHDSPLWVDEYVLFRNYARYWWREVDLRYNMTDLARRCEDCKGLIESYINKERLEV